MKAYQAEMLITSLCTDIADIFDNMVVISHIMK